MQESRPSKRNIEIRHQMKMILTSTKILVVNKDEIVIQVILVELAEKTSDPEIEIGVNTEKRGRSFRQNLGSGLY